MNIIIALGHSGYNFDKILASQAPDIDLVVGGHSHSFLYTGQNPSDEPQGKYLIVSTKFEFFKLIYHQVTKFKK